MRKSDVLYDMRAATVASFVESFGASDDELLKFEKVYEYEEEDGRTIKIYNIETAIICNNPDVSELVGELYFDGRMRLRNAINSQFVVRLDGSELVSHALLGNDVYFYEEGLNDEDYKALIMQEISDSLDRNSN